LIVFVDPAPVIDYYRNRVTDIPVDHRYTLSNTEIFSRISAEARGDKGVEKMRFPGEIGRCEEAERCRGRREGGTRG